MFFECFFVYFFVHFFQFRKNLKGSESEYAECLHRGKVEEFRMNEHIFDDIEDEIKKLNSAGTQIQETKRKLKQCKFWKCCVNGTQMEHICTDRKSNINARNGTQMGRAVRK